MRRLTRYVPPALLVLGVAAPFAAGCDLLKPKGTDAGLDGTVAIPAVTDTTQPANPAAPTATTAAPLNPAAPTHTAAPVAHTDGGADSGVHTDGGAAPAPLPPFPGFDAGALKGFDAGGLFRVPDGGFKPPWPVPTK